MFASFSVQIFKIFMTAKPEARVLGLDRISTPNCEAMSRFATSYIQHICEYKSHHWHPHCKFLCWYQEFLRPVETPYFSDEKSTTVEK